METVVFSVRYGSMVIDDNHINIIDINNRKILASTFKFNNVNNAYLLPTSLIRTDEVIAEEYCKELFGEYCGAFKESIEANKHFLAGRQSFGDKKYHLTREEIEYEICYRYSDGDSIDDIISSLTPSIYPHTITVKHDGDNYLWETLKESY